MIPLHDANPTSRTPVATLALIAVCVAVYFFWQPTPFSATVEDTVFAFEHAAIPTEVRSGEPLSTCEVFQVAASTAEAAQVCASPIGQVPFAEGKPVRLALVVSIFLHGSLLHLGFNLLFLWIFGNNVEDRLGPVRFTVFFVVAGVLATLAHILGNWDSDVPVLGASGAIAGVMGAYLVWFPRARITTLFFYLLLEVQARWVLLLWLVLQFFTNPNEGVAWLAHVGGFVVGVTFAVLAGPGRRPAPVWPEVP